MKTTLETGSIKAQGCGREKKQNQFTQLAQTNSFQKLRKSAEKEQLKLVSWRRKFTINIPERRTEKLAGISGTIVLQFWVCGGQGGQPDWFLEGWASRHNQG